MTAAVPVVGFVGRSGSGKTTLLELVVAALSAAGVRVAVIKHTHHRALRLDASGKDTARFHEAGAAHVTLFAPDQVVHRRRYTEEPPLDEVLAGVREVDLILVEGYKRGLFPKLEVVRAACDPAPLPEIVGRCAWVTDVPTLDEGLPRLPLDDIASVTAFIRARFLEEG